MTDRAPYPGLRSFKRDEVSLFFGRDDCVAAMLAKLAFSRFLAVIGPSGTGKSSLVQAGLLSGLEMGLLPKAGARWQIVSFRPGGSPLRNLSSRLLEAERSAAGLEAAEPDRVARGKRIRLLCTLLSRIRPAMMERGRASRACSTPLSRNCGRPVSFTLEAIGGDHFFHVARNSKPALSAPPDPKMIRSRARTGNSGRPLFPRNHLPVFSLLFALENFI